ncbi:DNA damage-binding protein 1 [Ascodesmis nigricans]|uniref:DNA damage-binding protein 1 n=1 Tax=Ascodesmis nigricans TaxID=341454 RepID=A0A4S2N016_9PEZI|nr:DNA damage-binding protein 1 [Ascodesmis nigricans]
MAYLASIHKASSVRFALKANFLSPDESSLIVAKSNRVEVYNFSGDGLNLRTSFTVYGRITGLLTIQPANSPTAHLLIATEAQDYLTVSWDAERHTIRNERAATDLADQFLRDAECGPLYRADPEGRVLGFHVYEGSLCTIPIVAPQKTGKRGRKNQTEKQIGDLETPEIIRMKQIKVADFVFLDGVDKPTIAVLHRDGATDSTTLESYVIPLKKYSEDLEPWKLEAQNLEVEAKFLIPVSKPMRGVLVVGEQSLTYVTPEDDTVPFKRPFSEASIPTAWGAVDNQRFLLADELGRLKVIFLEVKEEKVVDIKVENIGETAVASSIVYLDNGHVFIGSHFGDSQLVKLAPTDPKCQVIQAFPNLAPILDFQVLDGESGQEGAQEHQQSIYSSGQNRIVTGSGGYKDGGLRSMKNGVGLEDTATVLEDMEGVRSLWALQSNPDSSFDDTLVISLIDETRVIRFDPAGDVEELEDFMSFRLQEETLVTCNLPNGRLLQVTSSCTTLVDAEGGTVLAQANPGASISAASVANQYLICAVRGKEIICYDLNQDLQEVGKVSFEHEIACLNASTTMIAAVGFWTTQTISLLSLPDLSVRSAETLGDSIPRSIIIANLLERRPPTLLVAMGDGTMFTFTVDVDSFGLSEKKTVVLGTQAYYFYPVPREHGTVSVFAACDHPNLIYGEDDRIVYSAVTADNITQLHSFNSEVFPGSVAIMAGTELQISTIDPARTIHVKTLKVGDVIRRVSYSKEHQLFGVVTVHSDIDSSGAESFRCYMKLVDNGTFIPVDSYTLGENELVESLTCIKLDNGVGDGSTTERFLVGTGALSETSDEATGGRILVFEVSHSRKLKLVTEHKTRSGVKCLDAVGDKIVTAMNKTVDVFAYIYPQSSPATSAPALKHLLTYRAHTEPIDMSVSNNIITVGDIMKGPYLLQLTDENGKPVLQELARSYQPSWTTAVELLDDDTILAADNEGNIQIWERNKSGIAEDQKRLQVISEGKLWEMVNKIRRINTHFVTTDSTPITPKAHIATVDGSVYLLSLITPTYINLLLQLQTNLARVIKGIGDLQFMRFRAFSDRTRTADEPYRLVDGDFVERFLELKTEEQEFVIAGAGTEADKLEIGVDELRGLLEGLRRMH